MPAPARNCTCSPGCPFILGHPHPLKCFWDAQQDAHALWDAHAHQRICTHTMAMIPPSPSTVAPSLPWSTQPGHPPSDPLLSPISFSQHPFVPHPCFPWLIFCELQGWEDRCRVVGTWQGQGSGTVEMASPSFPLPCALWGRPVFGGQCSSVLHHCFEKPSERAVIYERFLVQGEINL